MQHVVPPGGTADTTLVVWALQLNQVIASYYLFNALIVSGLRSAFPADAILSEEEPFADDPRARRLWMVDPLDGTGSFIRMRSGYAINVALIESDGHDWHPILGIVALPDLDRIYFGGCGLGTWKARIDDSARPARAISSDEDITPPYDLLISWNEPGTLNDLVAGTVDPTQVRMRPVSGAAKFCLVTEGKADLHARSTGYYEWDCAAGDALFRSQGLAVCDIVTGRPLTYNGPHLRVGGLIASRIPTQR